MGFDALASAAATAAASAAAPRDIAGAARKKRSAKLKQCKLDARREQWISQVKNKNKVTSMATSPTSPLPPPPISLPTGQSYEYFKNDHEGSDSESPSHSPVSSGDGHGVSSGESSYRSQSEDGGGENEALDDWEAVADALFADCGEQDPYPTPATPEKPTDQAPAMQESIRSTPAPRAWKPDDMARPRSLPSLSKQRSYMVVMERQCGLPHTSSPTMCPICCEDLDVTDSSFLPCLCGFRLCLFCYKRILEEDGRCPGCRKQYDPVAGGTVDGGGDGISLKLSRSLSLIS